MTIIQAIKDLRLRLGKISFVNNDNVKWQKMGDGQWEALVAPPPPVSSTGGGGSSSFPAKIVSKSGAFYVVDKYENGIDAAATGTGNLFILQLNLADTLPAGTWVIASPSAIGVTGGGNVQ